MKRNRDYYSNRAKKEKYPARSVYKLEFIDRKYKLLHSGDKVLDLGASPGSWTKYALERIGCKGKIVAVDKNKLKIGEDARLVFIETDIMEERINGILKGFYPFSVVLSDLAPSTTGIRDVDQIRSYELALQAFAIAKEVLKRRGNFVVKVFQSGGVKTILNGMKQCFKFVKAVKPPASKDESIEVFLVGMDFY